MIPKTPIVAIFSGGLDSTTLVYYLLEKEFQPDLLSFDYGQKHRRELGAAAKIASKLGLRHDIIDLTGITKHLAEGGSSLISETDVPEGHYAEENMKATIVPNRNMIMLSVATGIAVARNIEDLAIGVHAGDHAVYPDCRNEFIASFEAAAKFATDRFMMLHAPFVFWSKNDIAASAFHYGVPVEETWSCYKGKEVHCGRCGTCMERIEAIRSTGNDDPTTYADTTLYDKYVGEGKIGG